MVSPLKIPLQVSCPNCQQANLPGSPYCNRCGAPLGDAVSAPATATTSFSSIDEDPLNRLLNEGQDKLLVKQSYERAFTILTTGESIEYVATASKTSLTHAPDCLVITNKRIMLLRKKVLGKYELDDCYWRDVRDLSVKDSKNGVVLAVEAIQGWRITADALPRAQARQVIELAASHNERIRDVLAQSNAFAVTGPSSAPVLPAVPEVASGSAMAAVAAPHTDGLTGAPVPPSPWTGLTPPSAAAESPARPAASMLSTNTTGERTGISTSDAPTVAPANFVPTPESVLQSILQQTLAAQQGSPTRPMPLSAAAFQAPALAEAQPVTFSETDTEPNMRPAPPMPTLEQIAVFSGPLAFGHPQSGEISANLPASSGPLDLNEETSVLDEQAWAASAQNSAVANAQHHLGAPSRPADTNVTLSNSIGANGTAGPSQKRTSAEASKKSMISEGSNETGRNPVPEESVRDHNVAPGSEIDLPLEVADLMGFMMSDSPAPDDERMPLPGTMSSGPLLEASNLESLNTLRLQQRGTINTGDLPTEHLYFDTSLDDLELDRPTDINLGQYNLPPAKAAKNGRSAASGNSSKSQSSRNSGSSSGTRYSQPKQSADDPIAKMKQLKMLLDAGFITESDYEAKKADILARYF